MESIKMINDLTFYLYILIIIGAIFIILRYAIVSIFNKDINFQKKIFQVTFTVITSTILLGIVDFVFKIFR